MRRCLLALALLNCLAAAPRLGATTFLHKRLSDWLQDLSRSSRPAARRSAAFALGRLGPLAAFALEDLERALRNDRDPGVRDMAAAAIGDIVGSLRHYTPKREWELAGETLERALRTETDPRIRRSAAYALGAFGELAAAAREPLRHALNDPHPAVRQNAAWALGRVETDPAGVVALCERLTDGESTVRRDAAEALGRLGDRLGRERVRAAAGPLLKLVRDEPDSVVRRTALGAVASLADRSYREQAEALYPLLRSDDAETARAAAYALGNMGGEPARRALGVLVEALGEPDPEVQALAAAALANTGAEGVVAAGELARTLMRSTQVEVRRNCAIALARIAEGTGRGEGGLARLAPLARVSVPALAHALKPAAPPADDPAVAQAQERVREYAAEAISQIGYPGNREAVPALRAIIQKDPNPIVRQQCVEALLRCRDLDRLGLTAVLAGVLQETAEESRMVRYDAARVLAWSLGERAPDRTAEVLLDMLGNPMLRVFYGSGTAISGLPNEEKGGMSRTTSSSGGDARFMAAEALGCLGDRARRNREVMAALNKAAADPDPMLRKHARQALERLGQKD